MPHAAGRAGRALVTKPVSRYPAVLWNFTVRPARL